MMCWTHAYQERSEDNFTPNSFTQSLCFNGQPSTVIYGNIHGCIAKTDMHLLCCGGIIFLRYVMNWSLEWVVSRDLTNAVSMESAYTFFHHCLPLRDPPIHYTKLSLQESQRWFLGVHDQRIWWVPIFWQMFTCHLHFIHLSTFENSPILYWICCECLVQEIGDVTTCNIMMTAMTHDCTNCKWHHHFDLSIATAKLDPYGSELMTSHTEGEQHTRQAWQRPRKGFMLCRKNDKTLNPTLYNFTNMFTGFSITLSVWWGSTFICTAIIRLDCWNKHLEQIFYSFES